MPNGERSLPRTFYLNEQHELLRAEKPGGGRLVQYHGIDWASKGRAVAASLSAARKILARSKDPLRDRHYFLLAKPVTAIQKQSSSTKAREGVVTEQVRFNESDSRVFRRLGIELLDVAENGDAIVHVRPERVDQLVATGDRLAEANQRERTRWASLDTFDLIPPELRIDSNWVNSMRPRVPSDAVIEFHSLLSRVEVDTLIHSIVAALKREMKESLTGIGTDFSGRHWVKGKITPESLRSISRLYYSVQTLHSPLISITASTKTGKATLAGKNAAHRLSSPPIDLNSLPTVAIVDTGVPGDHALLARYKRGQFTAPDSVGQALGDHGSFVASRIVFGDPDFGDEIPETPPPSCRYYDVLVASGMGEIDDKSVVPAIQGVVASAPDVRVFNLSFDTRLPLALQESTKQREHLLLVQDLDNLIFRNDLLVVVVAGNSPLGVQPVTAYPNHVGDPNWELGAWARSFNSMTCGSYVARLHPGGLATTLGWPSPFSRVGLGIADSPKPDISAHGGNASPNMAYEPGLGVQGLTAASNWEDRIGTSFAAPIAAREAASAFQHLQKFCTTGAKPYSVTVRAFLMLTAVPPSAEGLDDKVVARSLGAGTISHTRLNTPLASSAVLLWQGLLDAPSDVARVTVPIPKGWLGPAHSPRLRIVVCWDPPVNAAVIGVWATRKASVHLKANPDGKSLHGSRTGHSSYPVIDRVYDLRKLPRGETVEGDVWLIELSYEEICEYHSGIAFTPQQRIAFAAEIYDASETPRSPQSAIQSLPTALTMSRLSLPPQTIKSPVVIKPF